MKKTAIIRYAHVCVPGSQPTGTCSKRLLKFSKLPAYGWENCPWPGNCWLKRHILTERKGWKSKHFNSNMLYKLNLHKMKVHIKWNQKKSNQEQIAAVYEGDNTVNVFSNFCNFLNFHKLNLELCNSSWCASYVHWSDEKFLF